MTVIDAHPRGSLESLRCTSSQASLAGENEIDSLGRRQGYGEIHPFVIRGERTGRCSEVSLDYSLGTSAIVIIRALSGVDYFRAFIRRRLSVFNRSNRRVVAFVSLEDRTATLHRP